MKRNLVNVLTRALLNVNRGQRVRSSSPTKVNVGAGLAVAPGWINIDGSLNSWVSRRPMWVRRVGYKVSGAREYYSWEFYNATLEENCFVFHDVNFGMPFEDSAVDFVYSSHFLEHLPKCDAARLLRDCFRILKPDGVIRVVVPDLEHAWTMYQTGEKDRMLHDFFFTATDTTFSQHRYAYDFELLSRGLRGAGFSKVERCGYQIGRTPDLCLLDNRAEYSLFVEAQK